MPTIFCLLILFCIWLTYERKKHSKLEDAAKETFLETERKADIARKRDISSLDYITIPFDTLPTKKGTSKKLNEYIDRLLTLSQKPIVNLSHLTNTELKLQYGFANLELLSEYDENYYQLIRLLADWGQTLYEMNAVNESRTVCEYALSIGSDITSSLYTLAQIYIKQGKEDKFTSLKEQVSLHHKKNAESILLELEKIRCHQYFA